MKKILVLTDFSEHAGYAEKASISIARNTGAQIVFLHGIFLGVDWIKLPKQDESKYPEIKQRIGHAEQLLEERVKMAKDAGVEAIKELAFLDNYKGVSNTTLDHEHDMIVMGSHGGTGIKKILIGSNAAKIMRTAKAPVLVVQGELPDPLTFKTIVFASGLEPDTHPAFDKLLAFADAMGAKNLHLVEVTTPNNFRPSGIVLEELKNYTNHHKSSKIHLHNHNHYNVEAGIMEFAQHVKADLIAIANHGRTDISSLFIESIPANLVKYSDYPVLSIMV